MHNYKIIVDSACDISNSYAKQNNITIIPLTININNKEYIDNEDLLTDKLLEEIKASKEVGKTSCPSPQHFYSSFEGYQNIFVITMSSKVSGTYNSARIARDMYLEDHPNVNIHIFDTLSASAAECLITDMLIDLVKSDEDFDSIVTKVENKILNTKTYFILDDMDTLIKNGRITGVKAFIVSKLNIKAIMTQNNGEICQHDSGRGVHKVIQKLTKSISTNTNFDSISKLYISHVNAEDKVDYLIKCMKDLNIYNNFKNIVVNSTRGLSTFYANKGGLILAF